MFYGTSLNNREGKMSYYVYMKFNGQLLQGVLQNSREQAIAGLVKLTNHTGRGYSFKAIRAKLLYSNLPTFHRPVFDRSLEVRPPFTTMGEIKDYGVKFSTLYEMLGEV